MVAKIEILNKIQVYKSGIVNQFNHINNIIARQDQDEQTRKDLGTMVIMIKTTDKIIKHLK